MGHIWIAEDDPDFRDMLGAYLRRAGHRVWSAPDGTHVIEHLRGHDAPDLLVSDVNMPNLSGLELAESLRREHPGIPVVLMTGQQTADVVSRASGACVRELLRKPFSLQTLRSILSGLGL